MRDERPAGSLRGGRQLLRRGAAWEVIQGTPRFFGITKGSHNGLQGKPVDLLKKDWKIYQDVNEENAARLKPLLEEADLVIIHDPQPAYLLNISPHRKGKGSWRGNMYISRPFRPVWKA